MGRRGRPPEMRICCAFEATRTAALCLTLAYERLVPIPRRLPRQPVARGTGAGQAASVEPRLRSAKRG